MNNLKIFKNDNFGEIRTLIINNEPWFVGKDVAKALGFTNTRNAISTHVFDEDKGVDLIDTLGGKQKMTIINESGLYALVFGSRLKMAKEFKHWVTSEVLPLIRKTGSYTKPKSTMELLKLELKAIEEVSAKLDDVNSDLQDFKSSIPLFAVECEELTHSVNMKIVSILGGKDTAAYKDNHFRGAVYSDIYREIKRQFGVKSYKAIKRSDIGLAINIIQNYTLPLTLEQELSNFKNQISIN